MIDRSTRAKRGGSGMAVSQRNGKMEEYRFDNHFQRKWEASALSKKSGLLMLL